MFGRNREHIPAASASSQQFFIFTPSQTTRFRRTSAEDSQTTFDIRQHAAFDNELDKDQAELQLQNQIVGTYLIRNSSETGKYTLSLKASGSVDLE